jgi:4,5-dihydroxyphthalate decarboxylase
MSGLVPITLACGDYDRTRPIRDGRVPVDGCEVTFLALEPEELFFRAFRYQEFDVAELSFNSYLMQASRGICPYVAIPVFLSRHFRHSSIHIRTDRGIAGPQDLVGRLVGLPEYQQTANVWMRGIFQDDFGIDPSAIHWRTGGQEEPGRDERTKLDVPPGVEILPIGPQQTLNRMLVDGELDAVFSARELSCYTAGVPNIGLLYPDYRRVEQEYFHRTGIFPIMHLVGVRRTLVDRYPWLPGTLFKAFRQAKALAVAALQEMAVARTTTPWPEVEVQEATRLMGADFWRYGVAECAGEIETLARYSFEQGLAARLMTKEEIFHPTVFEISRT